MPVPEVVRRARTAQNSRQSRDGSVQGRNPRTKLLTMVFEAAQLFFIEKRDTEALAMCQRVLHSDPRNPEAAALLGDIYLAQDRKDKALLMFERAMLAQPTNLLYKKKWNALRRGEPVPASTFAPAPTPEAAAPENGASPTEIPETATSADGTPAPSAASDDNTSTPASEPSPAADFRAQLGLTVPVTHPMKADNGRKPLLGKLFGRGK